jgi:Serine-threonine protein kinase 19
MMIMKSDDYIADIRRVLAKYTVSARAKGESALSAQSHVSACSVVISTLETFIEIASKTTSQISILESELLGLAREYNPIKSGFAVNEEARTGFHSPAGDKSGTSVPARQVVDSCNSKAGSSSSRAFAPGMFDASLLLRLGFLSQRSIHSTTNAYWFSHPDIRKLQQFVSLGREKIIAAIRTAKYKELSTRELHKKLLSSHFPDVTPLSEQFHLLDCLGAGIIAKVDAPREIVYRLK